MAMKPLTKRKERPNYWLFLKLTKCQMPLISKSITPNRSFSFPTKDAI